MGAQCADFESACNHSRGRRWDVERSRERFSAELYSVVVANGRFVAGGLPIAPTADPSDGRLEVVLIPKLGAAEMALLAAEIVLGKHLSSNATIFRQAKKIAVRSRPGMFFNVDG